MTGHAHEFSPHGVPSAAICPGIEVLVHRRATELIAERPRRRVMTLSTMGGVAVATACAVLVLVIGSPSGSGLLSPRQAVAAVVQTLNGDGVLHWVRVEKVTGAPSGSPWPERSDIEQWLDLSNGNSHTVTETYRRGASQPESNARWIASGSEWEAVPGPRGAPLTIRRSMSVDITPVDDLRATLERADRGESEVAEAGGPAGVPLVVVTERRDRVVRRIWITREEIPQLVRIEAVSTGRDDSQPIVTTATTTSWQVLPRTPEALADVEIPTDAKRVP